MRKLLWCMMVCWEEKSIKENRRLQIVKSVTERLLLEPEEITCIVYRNDDMGIGGQRFKHIDVELIYGECIELVDTDDLYREIYDQGKVAEAEDLEEVILYQKKTSGGVYTE